MNTFTVDVFAKALDRAVQEGCKVRTCQAGFEVRSASNVHRWYLISSDLSRCTCDAKVNVLCKHRALVAYVFQRVHELCPMVSYNRTYAEDTRREVSVA